MSAGSTPATSADSPPNAAAALGGSQVKRAGAPLASSLRSVRKKNTSGMPSATPNGTIVPEHLRRQAASALPQQAREEAAAAEAHDRQQAAAAATAAAGGQVQSMEDLAPFDKNTTTEEMLSLVVFGPDAPKPPEAAVVVPPQPEASLPSGPTEVVRERRVRFAVAPDEERRADPDGNFEETGRGTPCQTDLDELQQGKNDLNLRGNRAPLVGGLGAVDFSKIPCAFGAGCGGCRKWGSHMQTCFEVCESESRSYAEQHPEATAARAHSAGWKAVRRVLRLIVAGDRKLSWAQRVCCSNADCQMAAGIMLAEDRAEWEAEQRANLKNGNKRYGNKDLFLNNLRLIRRMWVEAGLNEKWIFESELVDAACSDTAQWTFWAEAKQREFIGVAWVAADRAEDMRLPLPGRDVRQELLNTMAAAPYNFICTVLRDHVRATGFPSDIDVRPGPNQKPWNTVLGDHLKLTFPDAITTLHAFMMNRNWAQQKWPRFKDQANGKPLHQVNAMLLVTAVDSAVFGDARAFHGVVGPYMRAAHQRKKTLWYGSAYAAHSQASDPYKAIKAISRTCGGLCAGEKAELERMVMENTVAKQRTTATIPSSGAHECPYAPACNTITANNNVMAKARYEAALRLVDCIDAPGLANAIYKKMEKGGESYALQPAKQLFHEAEARSEAQSLRRAKYTNGTFGTACEAMPGAAKRHLEAAMLGPLTRVEPSPDDKDRRVKFVREAPRVAMRGAVSLIGMPIAEPTPEELPVHAAAVAEWQRQTCGAAFMAALRDALRVLDTIARAVPLPDEPDLVVIEAGLPTRASWGQTRDGHGWTRRGLEVLHPPPPPLPDGGSELDQAWHARAVAAHASVRSRVERLAKAHYVFNELLSKFGSRDEENELRPGGTTIAQLTSVSDAAVEQLTEAAALIVEAHAWRDDELPYPILTHVAVAGDGDLFPGLCSAYSLALRRALVDLCDAARRGKARMPSTIERSAVRDGPLFVDAKRAKLLAGLQKDAELQTRENFERLEAEGVLPPGMTLDDYTTHTAERWFAVAGVERQRHKLRWLAAFRTPPPAGWEPCETGPSALYRWHCADPQCQAAHAGPVDVCPEAIDDFSCPHGKSFAHFLAGTRVDDKGHFPTRESIKEDYCHMVLTTSQEQIDRLARLIEHGPRDSLAKVEAARKALAKAQAANDEKAMKKHAKTINLSSVDFRRELHASMVTKHNEVLIPSLSRFMRSDEADPETVTEAQGNNRVHFEKLEAELARFTGSTAQCRLRLRDHVTNKDDSVFDLRRNRYQAEAKTAAAHGVAVGASSAAGRAFVVPDSDPSGWAGDAASDGGASDSEGDDDSDDEDADRQAVRLEAATTRSRTAAAAAAAAEAEAEAEVDLGAMAVDAAEAAAELRAAGLAKLRESARSAFILKSGNDAPPTAEALETAKAGLERAAPPPPDPDKKAAKGGKGRAAGGGKRPVGISKVRAELRNPALVPSVTTVDAADLLPSELDPDADQYAASRARVNARRQAILTDANERLKKMRARARARALKAAVRKGVAQAAEAAAAVEEEAAEEEAPQAEAGGADAEAELDDGDIDEDDLFME